VARAKQNNKTDVRQILDLVNRVSAETNPKKIDSLCKQIRSTLQLQVAQAQQNIRVFAKDLPHEHHHHH
jgi:hypothetical protein